MKKIFIFIILIIFSLIFVGCSAIDKNDTNILVKNNKYNSLSNDFSVNSISEDNRNNIIFSNNLTLKEYLRSDREKELIQSNEDKGFKIYKDLIEQKYIFFLRLYGSDIYKLTSLYTEEEYNEILKGNFRRGMGDDVFKLIDKYDFFVNTFFEYENIYHFNNNWYIVKLNKIVNIYENTESYYPGVVVSDTFYKYNFDELTIRFLNSSSKVIKKLTYELIKQNVYENKITEQSMGDFIFEGELEPFKVKIITKDLKEDTNAYFNLRVISIEFEDGSIINFENDIKKSSNYYETSKMVYCDIREERIRIPFLWDSEYFTSTVIYLKNYSGIKGLKIKIYYDMTEEYNRYEGNFTISTEYSSGYEILFTERSYSEPKRTYKITRIEFLY